MSGEVRPWSEGCGGPDAFMELVFAPGCDEVLSRVVATSLPGFVGARIEGAMESAFADRRAVAAYDAYAEEERAASVHAHLRGNARENAWVYRVVTVGDSRVRFEDGYMGGDAATVVAESRLVVALACHPELEIVAWVVRSGGHGYDVLTIAEGREGRTLLERLVAR